VASLFLDPVSEAGVALVAGVLVALVLELMLMQTKELNNGRLTMIAAAGMCVQEQINRKGILDNLGF
jgi:hypothetical protein